MGKLDGKVKDAVYTSGEKVNTVNTTYMLVIYCSPNFPLQFQRLANTRRSMKKCALATSMYIPLRYWRMEGVTLDSLQLPIFRLAGTMIYRLSELHDIRAVA